VAHVVSEILGEEVVRNVSSRVGYARSRRSGSCFQSLPAEIEVPERRIIDKVRIHWLRPNVDIREGYQDRSGGNGDHQTPDLSARPRYETAPCPRREHRRGEDRAQQPDTHERAIGSIRTPHAFEPWEER